MLRRLCCAAFVVSFAVTAADAQTGRALPPVEAFGNLEFLKDAKLSPDGKHFAAMQPLDGKPVVVVYQVNAPAGTAPQVFGSGNGIVGGFEWLKNDAILLIATASKAGFFLDYSSKFGWARGILVDLKTGATNPTFGNNDSIPANSSTAILRDKDLDDPDTVFMPLWTRPKNDRTDNQPTIGYQGGSTSDYRYSLYKVDVRTGRGFVSADGSRFPSQWFMDGHGNVVARTVLLQGDLIDRLSIYDGSNWRDLRDFDASGDKGSGIVGLSSDGKWLVQQTQAPRSALVQFDMATGKSSSTLLANDTFDIDEALTDEWTGRVIGGLYFADKPVIVYFDPSREAVQRGLETQFPGAAVYQTSSTLAGDEMIVAVELPKQPATYYFLDRTTHEATKIASEYPDLTPSDLGEVRPYPYKARDGMPIGAYLTLPPGRVARNLPMVVMPHGGPRARDYEHFDWIAQFLANRGYVVLQPNFRGSTGYGRAFEEAGFISPVMSVQDDITDGVKKAIADGIADPKRICIFGASYGGYAALVGATFTPDLYACAASFAGVSDLGLMWSKTVALSGQRSKNASDFRALFGDDIAQLGAVSPAQHAENVKIPILLMHGKNDVTVLPEQSEEERDALERAGKTVRLVEFDTDDHYFNLAATRIGMLRELESFLHDHIGN